MGVHEELPAMLEGNFCNIDIYSELCYVMKRLLSKGKYYE